VETEEQLDRVRDAGCSRVQGYYYARPMTADQASRRLASEAAPDDSTVQIVSLR
jgi:EAL domain-containing protein (putative c-di-GMP-specific phosphodiesterase class I)